MTKPLKVNHAVCPRCHLRRPLDEEGYYERHVTYGEKFPDGTSANTVCDGSGLKASRMALRMERKRIRDLEAINRRHEERQQLKTELQPEVGKLQSGRSINADAFSGLLKAYGLWETIPPRRKNTIKDQLKCLHYDGSIITIVMHNSKASQGLMPYAQELLKRIQPIII